MEVIFFNQVTSFSPKNTVPLFLSLSFFLSLSQFSPAIYRKQARDLILVRARSR